ncbi:MAG: YaeQ family protein [Pseudomonadales bacterium]|nr:YaeQ family protein [Pseudomonadales bacterium]
MALKPTIYKFRISLSDLNRDYYDTLNLTIAQHPSETMERMLIRFLAYCLNTQERLTFSKGLSSPEEPDIWAQSLDGKILTWIDVGEPAIDRIKKATRVASTVRVYCFNRKAEVWWSQVEDEFKRLQVTVTRFRWQEVQAMAALVQRTMDLSITISGDSAYVAAELGECELSWKSLQAC